MITDKLSIEIDDQTFETRDHAQEAASLLRLAGRDPAVFDLFLLKHNGVEEHVKDGQIVDLHDGERFRTRQRVTFQVDGEDHTTWDERQEAGALMRLAGVNPTTHDLARLLGPGQYQTFTESELVDLRSGDDFVTVRHTGPVA